MSNEFHDPDTEEVLHAGDRHPADSGGGLTGATGALTPDATEEPFVPAELREIADPLRAGRVTEELARHAEHGAERGADDGRGPAVGEPTVLAEESGGYGSSHGLAADDPAYRLDRAPETTQRPSERPGAPQGDTDEYVPEEEHY
jgi:hypothetical protein